MVWPSHQSVTRARPWTDVGDELLERIAPGWMEDVTVLAEHRHDIEGSQGVFVCPIRAFGFTTTALILGILLQCMAVLVHLSATFALYSPNGPDALETTEE